MAKLIIPYIDYSQESATVTTRVADAIADGDITTLFNAIVGVTVDGAQKSKLQVETPKNGTDAGKATDPLAQREIKWFVSYLDATANKFGSFEIPCADLTLLANNTDKMDLSSGAGLTLVTQIESFVKSQDGNAVVVQSITFVGRRT